MSSDLPAQLRAYISERVAQWADLVVPADTLPLAVPSFGEAEVQAAVEVLLSGWLTMGSKVRDWEESWAAEVGTRHAVAVNSGSSALLTMLTALVDTGHLEYGQEIILPAVGWPTSVTSAAAAGLTPVLVDVHPDTLCLKGDFDRPVLAVHLMGCPAEVTAPVVIEDACNAHGARIGERPAGSVGIAAAFSFFFSHHVSTVEGGMVNTDDDDLCNALRSVRAHGWIRERSDKDAVAAAHPEIDDRFLFVTRGHNLRPTELAGVFGAVQTCRLEPFVQIRNRNHVEWCERIDALGLPLKTFPQRPGTRHAAFAFPLLLEQDAPIDRAELCRGLEARGITTRPISGSNLAMQPAFAKIPGARVEGDLPTARAVHERGLFVGQSHAFGPAHGEHLARSLAEALGA